MTTTDRTSSGTTARSTRWRPVDIVVASVLGVAGGLLLVLWNIAYTPVDTALSFYPPASALVGGVWLLPGVLGGLIIRRPGAAVYVELVAAVLSALVGNQWGFSTVYYGLIQGLGAELAFTAVRYRNWSLPVVLASGAAAGVVGGLLNLVLYYTSFSTSHQLVYMAFIVLSGVVVAGLGSWLLAGALRRTGALAPLASGRGGERV
ncbi:MAG: Substrate-specific component YkoE of thiamin-regulated ECF transporter for HydroxyMethylPyrimidine [uncultured Quadrisphaera sp.]|uniref:Substrate-specific component YkoE of thiamin-regulated ECF transporter for HydroxyMethylPyrimidine n=1 Tax=uncultured Quadrisphaera sp. TaxID=904978 RepID=A0A6J4P256_9ACTN|nr:MAG: Substrate-specific component YkoE of thiamin-regulated ECF transporter for HydroxyMethylPyrimidine [uncultured Quadrisphaera sp.]